jgi:lipopolysaccharide/colanic/teichoic acid biosynthesis glycosyltransferase
MRVNEIADVEQVSKNDPRITKIGKFIRKTSMDELPQFFNILMGDMSFVGPRPENQYFVNFYNEKKKRKIYTVRPGLTDFSSIDFFDETKFLKSYSNFENVYIKKILPIKQNNSIKYVKKQSFILDIIIIIKTLVRFLKIRSN